MLQRCLSDLAVRHLLDICKMSWQDVFLVLIRHLIDVYLQTGRGQELRICLESWNGWRSYQGTDDNIQWSSTVVRIPRTKSLVQWPVNWLYLIEQVQNKRKGTIESGDIVNNNKENSRPKIEALIMTNLKRNYLED